MIFFCYHRSHLFRFDFIYDKDFTLIFIRLLPANLADIEAEELLNC